MSSKTLIVLTIAILAQAIGNTCLSKGMKNVASASGMSSEFSIMLLVNAMQTPMIWLGTALLIVFFVFFAAALSWADLSLVLPASAFGYVLNVALASQYLHEPISTARWFGTLLIFAGVVMVSVSPNRGTSRDGADDGEGARDGDEDSL